MIELTVVGCSGSTSGPASPASCYLVRAPWQGGSYALVLDLGPGAFGALYRHLDPATLDAIGLTHLHPDHCLDVCGFFVAARYSRTAPWPRIPLLGPVGTLDRLSRAYEPSAVPDSAAPGSDPSGLADRFEVRAWGSEQTLGPFTVRTTRVRHPVETYAIRVTETATRASLTYSGDTGPSPELVALATGTDLLLCEAAFDRPAPGTTHPDGVHLTGAQAGDHAAAAGATRLMITHVPPWGDPEAAAADARDRFAGETLVARAGDRHRVGH